MTAAEIIAAITAIQALAQIVNDAAKAHAASQAAADEKGQVQAAIQSLHASNQTLNDQWQATLPK